MRRLIACLAWTAVVVTPLIVADLLGSDTKTLTRDVVDEADVPYWTGMLAMLANLAWALAAGACLASGLAVRAAGGAARRSGFLIGAAVAIGYLGLDDALLIHEEVVPKLLGVPEFTYLFLVLLAIAASGWAFRSELLRADPLVLGFAVALLAASAFEDYRHLPIFPRAAEDAFKLAGLGILVFWSCSQAVATGRALGTREDAPAVRSQ